MPVVDVSIADLVQEPMRKSRGHLHSERVAYYLQHLDQSSPVTVFDINGHLLLADGHHRVQAAQQLGRSTIKAEVRHGSRGDALRFAIDLARAQGGLSEEEALAAIQRRADRGTPPL
jgi:ParB-like chromosome segregation protein Spo0J